MAKKSISVTLEEKTINALKNIADEEMRSVSNLIDYIVAQYAKSLALSVSGKIDKAVAFASNVNIENYADTNKALLNNVVVDGEDEAFIKKLLNE
ncbi:MAG: hypothetical protein ACI4GC_00275 [Acutalibacteraceae bacterium]